jgi:sec-independent protein translocase protein TatC
MTQKRAPFFKTLSHVFRAGIERKVRRQVFIEGVHENTLSFIEHVQQLRSHVVRSFIWMFVFSGLCFGFMSPLLTYLKKPYDVFLNSSSSQHAANLMSISIFEVMTVNFKICFFIGFALSLPFILFELWKFVSPALYHSEKKVARFILFVSLILFYSGILFGYYMIIPYFFQNALSWASHYASVMISYESYFNTLTTMLLIFAIIFEVPVALSLLGLAGILPSSLLAKNRRICFLGCFILGAILAPPDVVSLCLVSFPMYLMVEISIYSLKKIEQKKEKMIQNTP